MSPAPSGSKNKAKQENSVKQEAMFGLLFEPEYDGDMFLRNVC
jgi:hypothetical protein